MSLQVLRVSDLQKYYGAKLILDDVNLMLNHGDRSVLVGENGAGKSTLARLIIGGEDFDSGEISLTVGTQVGYLPQELRVDSRISVAEFIEQGVGELSTLRQRLRELELLMAERKGLEAGWRSTAVCTMPLKRVAATRWKIAGNRSSRD